MLLPSSPAGRTLAVGAGIDSLGTGMFFASFALYFVGVVGFAATDVALAATLAGAVALLAPVPLGRLADRVGTGRFYIALLLLRGLGYGCFAFVSDFKGFLVLTVLLTAADRASSPDPAGRCDGVDFRPGPHPDDGVDPGRPQHRADRRFSPRRCRLCRGRTVRVRGDLRRKRTLVRRGRRHGAPRAVKDARGGVAHHIRLRPPQPIRMSDPHSAIGGSWSSPSATACLSLYDTVLIVLLPIWVIEHTAVPVALVPVLMAVNTVLTVLLQVYVARFADGPSAAIRLLVASGVLMAVCCGFFAMAQAASATFGDRGDFGCGGGAFGRREHPGGRGLGAVRGTVAGAPLAPGISVRSAWASAARRSSAPACWSWC